MIANQQPCVPSNPHRRAEHTRIWTPHRGALRRLGLGGHSRSLLYLSARAPFGASLCEANPLSCLLGLRVAGRGAFRVDTVCPPALRSHLWPRASPCRQYSPRPGGGFPLGGGRIGYLVRSRLGGLYNHCSPGKEMLGVTISDSIVSARVRREGYDQGIQCRDRKG